MKTIEEIKNNIKENIQEIETYKNKLNTMNINYNDSDKALKLYYNILDKLKLLEQEKINPINTDEIKRKRMLSLVEYL